MSGFAQCKTSANNDWTSQKKKKGLFTNVNAKVEWKRGSQPRSDVVFQTRGSDFPWLSLGPKNEMQRIVMAFLWSQQLCFVSSKYLWMRLCLAEIKEVRKHLRVIFEPWHTEMLTIIRGISCVYENRYVNRTSFLEYTDPRPIGFLHRFFCMVLIPCWQLDPGHLWMGSRCL